MINKIRRWYQDHKLATGLASMLALTPVIPAVAEADDLGELAAVVSEGSSVDAGALALKTKVPAVAEVNGSAELAIGTEDSSVDVVVSGELIWGLTAVGRYRSSLADGPVNFYFANLISPRFLGLGLLGRFQNEQWRLGLSYTAQICDDLKLGINVHGNLTPHLVAQATLNYLPEFGLTGRLEALTTFDDKEKDGFEFRSAVQWLRTGYQNPSGLEFGAALEFSETPDTITFNPGVYLRQEF